MANILDSNIMKSLQKYFKLGFKDDKNAPLNQQIFPMSYSKNEKGERVLKRENLDKESDKLYEWWLKNTHQVADDWKQRASLFDDMDMLYFNCPLISRAIELIADEVIQADSNDQPIFIEAKSKVKKYIQNFFDQIGLYHYLRPLVVDIVQYGNAGWLLGFDDKGISEIIPMDVYSLKDRLEFSPYETKQKMQNQDKFLTQYVTIDRINSLISHIQSKEENTSYYKKYLIGFQLEDRVVPPWRFLHFRNPTNKSPFRPFGIPVFIHAMSAYRQYDAAMTLQQMARMNRFPKFVLKVNLPSAVNPTDKLEKSTEVMNEWLNVGFGSSKKELPGIGDYIIIPEGLMTFEQISPEIDLGKIDDLELLRDEIIVATQLPRYIIDPKDSGFGDTGIALTQKWKPFARLIYRIQNIVLENITQLVKIHMIQSQEFSVDDIDFTLSMKYPEAQTSPDIITSQSSLFDLANSIIDKIQDTITGGELLPPELIKDIYSQFLPYDTDRIERWIDEAKNSKLKGDTVETPDSVRNEKDIEDIKNMKPISTNSVKYSGNNYDEFQHELQIENKQKSLKIIEDTIKTNNAWKVLESTLGKSNLKETINDLIFDEKQKVLRNSTIRDRHVYSSRNKYIDFPAEQLREFDKEVVKNNNSGKKIKILEEVKYNF